MHIFLQVSFYICQFPGGSHSVVPSNWVFRTKDNEVKCRWTGSLSKIKSAAVPNSAWPVYDVTKIVGMKNSYDEADQDLSDMNSDSQTNFIEQLEPQDPSAIPRKRTVKTTARQSDEDGVLQSKFRKMNKKVKAKKSVKAAEKNCEVERVISASRSGQLPKAPEYSPHMSPRSSTEVPKALPVVQKELLVSPSPSTSAKASEVAPVMQQAASASAASSTSSAKASVVLPVMGEECIDQLPQASSSEDEALDPHVTAQSVLPGQYSLARLHEMSKEILKCVHQLKGQMNSMQQDIDRIKTALAAQLPPEHQEEVFHFTLHDEDDIDAFEEFCNRLKNANFRQLVMRHLSASFSQRDIGAMVRSVLRATMTDRLQVSFNRTGSNGKRIFPTEFEHCLYVCAKQLNRNEAITVKRAGTDITTTVKKEVGKQIEVFLSNAKGRIDKKNKQQVKDN